MNSAVLVKAFSPYFLGLLGLILQLSALFSSADTQSKGGAQNAALVLFGGAAGVATSRDRSEGGSESELQGSDRG